ncbi:major facilitator superfamily domain-containing protein 12-like [Lineus longissimus]|uniref:major facilitator superfamily domain-containing protein 12-like n=1 Tax=Lineus longissimus TaxID=88925 RepID=UPI002B4EB1D4
MESSSTSTSVCHKGKLSMCQKLSYGVGHFLNDLCASMWFTYLLIYLHKVINFSNSMAGNLMLLGQIADGICTPFIGYESDRTKGIGKYGKRKTWHLIGTICVACTFAFLFNQCITCSGAADWAKFIYYAPFVVIFQFGWASTQISHLSLIPHLTPDEHDRVELNAIRYSFTVIANLVVFGLTWVLLDVHNTSSGELSVQDAPRFRDIAFIVVGIGIVFSIIFHVGTREKDHACDSNDNVESTLSFSSSTTRPRKMKWKCWFKEPQFYIVGLIYMCTRLIVNMSQVYLPMYLQDTLGLKKDYIAIIPLVVYISGFLTTFLMKIINKLIGKKPTYFIGLIFVAGGCVWMWFIATKHLQLQVIGAAICLGIGGTTILVTSLSMTADLIACSLENSAFVYGAMSFLDKVSNGLAVFAVQQLHPCQHCCVRCEWYYRDVMVFGIGGAVIAGIIGLLLILPQKIGTRTERKSAKLQCVPPGDSCIQSRAPLLNGEVHPDGYGTLAECSNISTVHADVHAVQT